MKCGTSFKIKFLLINSVISPIINDRVKWKHCHFEIKITICISCFRIIFIKAQSSQNKKYNSFSSFIQVCWLLLMSSHRFWKHLYYLYIIHYHELRERQNSQLSIQHGNSTKTIHQNNFGLSTLSRNQSMEWFLYDRDFCHEIVHKITSGSIHMWISLVFYKNDQMTMTMLIS